jgi:hypothetical protein
MSQTHLTTASSSNFQLMFDNALNKYKKRTKKDLREHPLAARLQSCDSPSAILVVLQEQLQGLDPSRSTDERWTKWLDPTVNVLYAFSSIVGSGVGLVCLRKRGCLRSALSYFCASYSLLQAPYLLGSASCFQCVSFITSCGAIVTRTFLRQSKMYEQAKTHLSTSLKESKCFSDVSRSTQKYNRPRE